MFLLNWLMNPHFKDLLGIRESLVNALMCIGILWAAFCTTSWTRRLNRLLFVIGLGFASDEVSYALITTNVGVRNGHLWWAVGGLLFSLIVRSVWKSRDRLSADGKRKIYNGTTTVSEVSVPVRRVIQ